MPSPDPPTGPCAPAQAALGRAAPEEVVARHRRVHSWWMGDGVAPQGLVGLALSGGGIRSATFSLGVAQALARRGKFGAVDVLSTVSGGSYMGCFLRSLFLPERLRGIDQPPRGGKEDALSDPEMRDQLAFAERALASRAGQRLIDGPAGRGAVCNPIWWLREHSRYLAPNGPGDFGYAAALLARNWIAMLYVFAIGIAAPLLVCAGIELLLHQRYDVDLWPFDWPGGTGQEPSPILLLTPIPLALACGLGAAYWLTVDMSSNERDPDRQLRNFRRIFLRVLLIAGLLALSLTFGDAAWRSWTGWEMPALQGYARFAIVATLALILLELALGALYVAAAGSGLTAAIARRGFWGVLLTRARGRPAERGSGDQSRSPQLLTTELRLVLTRHLAIMLGLAGLLLALGLVETLAAVVRTRVWGDGEAVEAGIVGVSLPALAFLIKKIGDWTKEGKTRGRIAALALRFLPMTAALVGVLLFGAVAVAVDAVILAGAWDGPAWSGTARVGDFLVMGGVIAALMLLTGRSSGFLNVSSWHGFYASRLTRAYLGGTNVDRLRSLADEALPNATIRDNHSLDYIQPAIYARTVLPAPLHVINMTVNRTVNPQSQFAALDRRGEPATICPEGVRLGAAPTDERQQRLLRWTRIGGRDTAENLSLGQWCAISGAAVSTAMGRRTSAGLALLTSFANVRLGYWWHAPALGKRWSWWHPTQWLPTFVYLKNELTARYARTYDRQYLSDGGHFENTGAYALVKRRVPLILVSDNGEDADYRFEDLENLVRVSRLDLRAEVTMLRGPALAQLRRRLGCERTDIFVDPDARPDWKAGMKDGRTRGFALAFEVCHDDGMLGVMLVVKPRLLSDLPEDVDGFARANPDFPQQTTGDQFFGEAQWESYRCLGETLTLRLLDACPRLLPERGARAAAPAAVREFA